MDARTARFPAVDYRSHPAFRDLDYVAAREPRVIERILGAIDHAVDGLDRGSEPFGQNDLAAYFEAHVDPQIGAFNDYVRDRCDLSATARECVARALPVMRERLLVQATLSQKTKNRADSPRESSASKQVAADLETHGVSAVKLESSRQRELAEAVRPYGELVRAKRSAHPEVYCTVALPLIGRHWRVIHALFDEIGFFDGAAKHRGYPMEISLCVLVLSHPRETWWREPYGDIGLPTPRTVQMHADDAEEMLKVILYLDNVDLDQGPFSYIKGSHRWYRSRAYWTFLKCTESAFSHKLGRGLKENSFYYRTQFRRPEQRRDLLALPAVLQGATHFGDDVLDSTELSERLLTAETRFTSDTASCMIFDGGRGIHRGGMVTHGERWALQIGLIPQRRLSKRLSGRIKESKRWVRRRLRDPVRAALRSNRG